MRHPTGEETKRHMLQQDGCTGEAVFLTYKTVQCCPCIMYTQAPFVPSMCNDLWSLRCVIVSSLQLLCSARIDASPCNYPVSI